MRARELGHRGEFDHRLDLVFEQHREHDDIAWIGADQPGADLSEPGRDVVDDDRLCARRALADQALSDRDDMTRAGVAGVGISSKLA